MFTHNQYISNEIRNENDLFNQQWVLKYGMIGETTIPVEELDVDKSRASFSNSFHMVWLRNVDRLLGLLSEKIHLCQYRFIDAGCGSGIAALYVFSNYSVKSVFGFDFSRNLVEMAEKNKDSILRLLGRVMPVDFAVADALNYRLPDDKIILFLFNPFQWEVLKVFVENNLDVLKRNRSFILYANDVWVNEVSRYGDVVARDDFFNLSVIRFF